MDLLLPGSQVREVILRASDGLVLEVETETVGGSEAAFLADVAALVASGGTIGLPAGGQAAADANPGWDLRTVEYDIEAGVLLIESTLRQGGQSIFFEVLAADGSQIDPPPGGPGAPGAPGAPVDAAGAIAIAEGLFPALTSIEIDTSTDGGQPTFEVELLDPNGPAVIEVEIVRATGAVIGSGPLSLSPSDLAEAQALASLLPFPVTLTEAVDLVLAETGPGEIVIVDFDVAGGGLRVDGTVLVNGTPVSVTIDPGAPSICPGDVNADLAVDFEDLLAVLAAFGTSVEPGAGADADASGSVDLDDLLVVLAAFGSGCG